MKHTKSTVSPRSGAIPSRLTARDRQNLLITLRFPALVSTIHLLPALACGDVYRGPGDVAVATATSDRDEMVLSAGNQAQFNGGGGAVTIQQQRLGKAEVERLLQWRQGLLVCNGQLLSEVVEDINRYNERQLVIDDEKIAGLKIAGSFRATDLDGFLAFLKAQYGIRATYANSTRIRIFKG